MVKDEPEDERVKRWKTDEQGSLLIYKLTNFEVAHVGNNGCALQLEFATADDERRTVQLSVHPSDAIRLAGTLGTLGHHAQGLDPRPRALHGAINDVTTPAPYPEVGHCIYCGATRHSDTREHMGEEHIIPLALGGDWILPLAACGRCEGLLNSYEQYCHKLTFGPLRYHLGLPTRRPKERPETLSLECMIGGEWVTQDVPIDSMPMSLLMPIFDLPDIVLDKDPVRPKHQYEAVRR